MLYESETVMVTANASGYSAGDYCVVHTNDGDGSIDWTNAYETKRYSLDPNQNKTEGWGDMPWGDGAWGTGYTTLTVPVEVAVPGLWMFGLKSFDTRKNAHTGTPGEAEVYVTPRPRPPLKMVPASYDDTNDILVMTLF